MGNSQQKNGHPEKLKSNLHYTSWLKEISTSGDFLDHLIDHEFDPLLPMIYKFLTTVDFIIESI